MGWVECPRGRRVGRLGKALSVEGTRLEHCDVTGSYGSCRGDYPKIDLGDLYIEHFLLDRGTSNFVGEQWWFNSEKQGFNQ